MERQTAEAGDVDRKQRCLVMVEVLHRMAKLLTQDGWLVPKAHVEAAIAALTEGYDTRRA
ncbi:hypothetical protein [Novosphingobium sp. B 225]|uniref:hypothetical protein n=1 Tax=Novosphingobium sp. B 225 TaxID=1961849 RepID=UPI001124E1E0|nr:hypothetical protein [Novosphingobium sp. B 225]